MIENKKIIIPNYIKIKIKNDNVIFVPYLFAGGGGAGSVFVYKSKYENKSHKYYNIQIGLKIEFQSNFIVKTNGPTDNKYLYHYLNDNLICNMVPVIFYTFRDFDNYDSIEIDKDKDKELYKNGFLFYYLMLF